jgi:hypothetical protein
MPGNDEDADLGYGTDPADATESAGEVERELGGADVFVLRWKIVPWVVVELMKDGWLAISERVVSWEVPRGRGATIFDERGEGGVGLEGAGRLRGVPGDPVDGDGIGGKGWESRFVFRGGFMTFSSTLRLDPSGISPSSYSSVKASKPLEPVLL